MKFERLALPIGHDRKPFVPTQPNYGRLLNFAEEEKLVRDTREHNLNTPYVPLKETPKHTIPLHNPQIERLAQPKNFREPRQKPQSQLKAPAQNGARPISAPFTCSVSLKVDLPPRADTSSKNRSHSTGKSLNSSQTRSHSDQSIHNIFLKRHQRRTEALNQLAASYKGDGPQYLYRGTTIISYKPSALAEVRERCASIGVSKVEWKNLEPLRRTGSALPSRPRREEGSVLRSASACPPATRAIANEQASEKVQIVLPQPAPKKSIDTMPKPPMQIRTRRFVCDDGNSGSVPWEKDPPPVTPMIIYATAR